MRARFKGDTFDTGANRATASQKHVVFSLPSLSWWPKQTLTLLSTRLTLSSQALKAESCPPSKPQSVA